MPSSLKLRSTTMKNRILNSLVWIGVLGSAASPLFAFQDAKPAAKVEYASQVAPIFKQYCSGCHNDRDREGEFSLSSYASLIKGTSKGAVVLPGKVEESPLVKALSAEGKLRMPPLDEPQLTADQKELIQRWVHEGAVGSDPTVPLRERLKVRSVDKQKDAPNPIGSMVVLDSLKRVAVGSTNYVGLRNTESLTGPDVASTREAIGKIAQLRVSQSGKLVVASGLAGVGGQVTLFSLPDLTIEKNIEVGEDALYAASLSPDGKWIAAGGYDRTLFLIDAQSGNVVRRLEGHNGAIYDVDFNPSSTLLASASGDETVKIWSVATGERLDTLGQGEGEQYSVRFNRDGSWVTAAGADRRIRAWRIISTDKPAVNPMLHSVFAHEGPVLAIAYSRDGSRLVSLGEDKKVKLWNGLDMKPLGELGTLNDTPTSASFGSDQSSVLVSTMSGTIERFAIDVASSVAPRSKEGAKLIDIGLAKTGPADSKSVALNEIEEVEPNSEHQKAQSIAIPAKIKGKIFASKNPEGQGFEAGADTLGAEDEDWFAFDAKQGEVWFIEVDASRKGSPLDSRVEIFDAMGKPVLRTRMQAVRESYFTFRGKSSDTSDDFRLHRWEDMELNEWLYAGGEIVKLWLYPRGPDSGFKVYPGFGSRYTYFDTTASAHALGETTWIVRELGRDEAPIPNGLPVFPIYFESDDEGQRRFKKDSKLRFEAPADGKYYVRLRDTRGQSGEKYSYELSIRPPKQSFSLSCNVTELPIVPGSSREFEVTAVREDGFEGPIDVRLLGLPEGFTATQPLYIEAGQHKCLGIIRWKEGSGEEDPKELDVQVQGVARLPEGELVQMAPKPIKIKRAEGKRVSIEVYPKGSDLPASSTLPLVLRAGESISAKVIANRGEFKGDIGFGTDDCGRNLPHGVIVGNIGLSGLLIPAGQTQQELFLEAAPWIEPQERLFHLRANIDGNPTTIPILLRIIK